MIWHDLMGWADEATLTAHITKLQHGLFSVLWALDEERLLERKESCRCQNLVVILLSSSRLLSSSSSKQFSW